MRFDQLLATVQGSAPGNWEVLSPARVEFLRVDGADAAAVMVDGHSDVFEEGMRLAGFEVVNLR